MAERVCPGCRQLQRRVAEWEALVRDLQARLGRGVEEVVATVCGVPVSLGTVAAVAQEASAALAAAPAAAVAAVRPAPAKNADETSWTEAGRWCWLGTALTDHVAGFVSHARRGAEGLSALLGATITGIVTSDRWGA